MVSEVGGGDVRRCRTHYSTVSNKNCYFQVIEKCTIKCTLLGVAVVLLFEELKINHDFNLQC